MSGRVSFFLGVGGREGGREGGRARGRAGGGGTVGGGVDVPMMRINADANAIGG